MPKLRSENGFRLDVRKPISETAQAKKSPRRPQCHKWHRHRRGHFFYMLVQNGQVRFIHFLFLVFFWQPKCRRMQDTASVNLHLRLFPAVMSSLSSNRLAMLLPNRAWQTRPFEYMCRRQKTCNRKPCTHDNDGCRTSVTAAGKRGFPLVRCAALWTSPWRIAPSSMLPLFLPASPASMPIFPCRHSRRHQWVIFVAGAKVKTGLGTQIF